MLCPTTASAAKLVNKYIDILFKSRKCIDSGEHISCLTFPPTTEQLGSADLNISTVSDSDGSYIDDSSF